MATKLKAKAQTYTCQSREDAQAAIKTIGDLQRQRVRHATELNDRIAEISAHAVPTLDTLDARIMQLQNGVQGWCEANREELCGKGKTANLLTGEVNWRARPPSVGVRGMDAVLACLKSLGLAHFIRVKEEVNKEAMLNEPGIARTVPGITIQTGIEDFIITPFENSFDGASAGGAA
jgi:phage host-nuclease inhibitor protein Gam